MKNKLAKILTGALAMVALSSCGGGGSPSDSKTEVKEFPGSGYLGNDYYSVEKTIANVEMGKPYQINVTSFPTQYIGKSIKFKSLDESIATVSETGLVSGVKKGITDIELSSEDGRVSTLVHVFVTEKSSYAGVKTQVDNIKAAYADPDHKKCNKFYLRERTVDIYSCEGVDDHGMDSFESMAFDYKGGYFMVDGEDLDLLTQNGSVAKSSGTWVFYTLNYGQAVRLFHITPNGKTYMEFNPGSKYLKKEGEAILDVLDMFFSSGRKIVTDMMDDVENDTFASDVVSAKEVYACDDKSIAYTSKQSGNSVVSPKDELDYFDIRANTPYVMDYEDITYQSGDGAEGFDFTMLMKYEQDGKNWTRKFARCMSFTRDFEPQKFAKDPKDDGFQLVDTIYDL